jgi:hypothetical protein
MPSISKTIAAGALLACAALSTAGCAENESSLFVIGVFAIGETQCLAEPDASAVLLSAGTLDRLLADGYQAAFLVGSHLTQQGSREKLRTETSRLQIQGAHVTIYNTAGAEIPVPDAAATGLVHPASGTDPGLAAVFAQLIRPSDFSTLGAPGQAIVRVRFFGRTLGGQEIESGDYDFPINVCDGCLITYPSEAADPTAPAGQYLCDPAVDTTVDTVVCNVGQDALLPCTACAGFIGACRDPLTNPSIVPP